MLKTAELKTAAVLAIIGGVTSTVSGGLIWVPYAVTWVGYGIVPPLLGFIGFILGMLVILGGIFIIRGRGFLGGNLVIGCGVASVFGGGFSATAQALLLLGITGYGIIIFSITLVTVFPVLGGVLALISRGTKGETN